MDCPNCKPAPIPPTVVRTFALPGVVRVDCGEAVSIDMTTAQARAWAWSMWRLAKVADQAALAKGVG